MTTGTNGQAVFDTPFSLSIKTRNEVERLINAADEMGNATTDAAYITAKMEYFDAVCGVIKSVQAGLNRVENDVHIGDKDIDDDLDTTCFACGGEGYIWPCGHLTWLRRYAEILLPLSSYNLWHTQNPSWSSCPVIIACKDMPRVLIQ